MNQRERRQFLIHSLLRERQEYRKMGIPADEGEQRQLLRGLMNIRASRRTDGAFLKTQDAYLQGETAAKGITDIADLSPVEDDIYLWRGDITTLKCGAIVNAANSGMTGCYQPCHNCIDNCIHTFAGIRLRGQSAAQQRQQNDQNNLFHNTHYYFGMPLLKKRRAIRSPYTDRIKSTQSASYPAIVMPGRFPLRPAEEIRPAKCGRRSSL